MLWHNAVRTELDQIHDYDTFCDMGIGVTMDSNHHKINTLLHECKTSKEPIQGNLRHPRDADVQRTWCVVRDIRRHQ